MVNEIARRVAISGVNRPLFLMLQELGLVQLSENKAAILGQEAKVAAEQLGTNFLQGWRYFKEELREINDASLIEKSMKAFLAPSLYSERPQVLREYLNSLNNTLCQDGFKLTLSNETVKIIEIHKSNKNEAGVNGGFKDKKEGGMAAGEALRDSSALPAISLSSLKSTLLKQELEKRVREIKKAHEAGIYFAALLLCRHSLEQVLKAWLKTSSHSLPRLIDLILKNEQLEKAEAPFLRQLENLKAGLYAGADGENAVNVTCTKQEVKLGWGTLKYAVENLGL